MSKGRETSPEITVKYMVTNKQNSNTSGTKPRTILQDKESKVFQTLYAQQCLPHRPKNGKKVKLSLSSSLPPKPLPTNTTEDKNRCTSSPNQKIIVDYSDDDTGGTPPTSPEIPKSRNKFAVRTNQCTSINLLETKSSSPLRRSPRKKEGIKTGNFYNNPSSPKQPFKRKTYSRTLPSNGRVQKPLAVAKVKTIPSSQPDDHLDTPIPRKRYPPYNISPGLDEFRRKGLHVGGTQVYHPMRTKYGKKRQEMETIDLLSCEEVNTSTPSKRTCSKENTPSKPSPRDRARPKCDVVMSPSNEVEKEPAFSLDYDDDDDLPFFPALDEPMDYTQEDDTILKMEISNILFGDLRCEPLENLEITPELFKLHIKFNIDKVKVDRLLTINRENIENIEINILSNSGFIVITPKLEFYDKLSVDLRVIPTVFLNKGDSSYLKRVIMVIFNSKEYPIKYVYHKLVDWFIKYFPVNIDEKDNFKFFGYDNHIDPSASERNANAKNDSVYFSSLNSPTVSQNITVSSSESPAPEENAVLPEVDHSYPTKGSRSQTEHVIAEFFKLVDSEQTKLLTFPEAGHPRRITIPKDTIRCLEPEMFLNDTIIEFYLRYILHQVPPEQREEVHIFNTFFYTKLTNNLGTHLTAENSKQQHALVSKWTKNVDLFEKNFILVPIHDHAHWFLAIICYPSLVGKEPIFSIEEDSDIDSMDISKQPNRKRKPRIEKKACILIFDSLEINRTSVINTLRSYLQAEWDARHTSDASYNCTNKTLAGHHPRLPIQPNSWDCGLFLMQYAECFVYHPLEDFNFPLKLENWFSLDEIKHKRNQVIKLIFDLSRDERYSIKRV